MLTALKKAVDRNDAQEATSIIHEWCRSARLFRTRKNKSIHEQYDVGGAMAQISCAWHGEKHADSLRGLMLLMLGHTLGSDACARDDDNIEDCLDIVSQTTCALLRTESMDVWEACWQDAIQWQQSNNVRMANGNTHFFGGQLCKKLASGMAWWIGGDGAQNIPYLTRFVANISTINPHFVDVLFAHAVEHNNTSIIHYYLRQHMTSRLAFHLVAKHVGHLRADLHQHCVDSIQAAPLTLNQVLYRMSTPLDELPDEWRLDAFSADYDIRKCSYEMDDEAVSKDRDFRRLDLLFSLFVHDDYAPMYDDLVARLCQRANSGEAPHVHACRQRHLLKQHVGAGCSLEQTPLASLKKI